MKKIFTVAFAALILQSIMTSCASTAGITVGPKEEFVLGELADHGFSAQVNNVSNDQIDVVIIDTETREQTQEFGLPGKSQAKIDVSKKETVLLKNRGDNPIKLKAKLNRSVEGMRYQEIESNVQINPN